MNQIALSRVLIVMGLGFLAWEGDCILAMKTVT